MATRPVETIGANAFFIPEDNEPEDSAGNVGKAGFIRALCVFLCAPGVEKSSNSRPAFQVWR